MCPEHTYIHARLAKHDGKGTEEEAGSQLSYKLIMSPHRSELVGGAIQFGQPGRTLGLASELSMRRGPSLSQVEPEPTTTCLLCISFLLTLSYVVELNASPVGGRPPLKRPKPSPSASVGPEKRGASTRHLADLSLDSLGQAGQLTSRGSLRRP